MPFALPDLSYDYAALEPYIDGTTMNVRAGFHSAPSRAAGARVGPGRVPARAHRGTGYWQPDGGGRASGGAGRGAGRRPR